MTAHVCSYLSAAATRDQPGGQPLFTCGSRTATAKQVAGRVAALALGLAQRLGVQPGDCVCLAALATDHNLEALLAITAAGGVAAPLNWRWGAAEGAYATGLVDAKLLVADAACLPFATGVAAAGAAAPGGGASSVQTLLLLGSPTDYCQADLAAAASLQVVFAEALIAQCPCTSLLLRSAPGNAALVVFTSGTTGKPKGVALSHTALHVQSMAKLLVVGYRSSDVYLHAAPLFHIGGLSSALAMLMAGARHVFLPRFEPGEFLAAAQQHSVTSFIAVPAMVAALVDAAAQGSAAKVPPAQLPSVTTVLLGGGGTTPALRAGLRMLCPNAAVHTAYGMTEACSSMTFQMLWGPGSPAGAESAPSSAAHAGGVSVGSAPPGIELAVYHPPQGLGSAASGAATAAAGPAAVGAAAGGATDWGRVVYEGEGEVVTRGPHVMLGYWEDEGATQAAFLPGGWMRTGDLGFMRQGELWLMGRAKDMIKSGGENVHAWEVERALASHPAVAAAAVVGVSDWRLGEAVAAAVMVRPGWEWRAPRCQVLLQGARAQVAAVAAAAESGRAAAGVAAGAAMAAASVQAAAGAEREAVVAEALNVLTGAGNDSSAEQGPAAKLEAAGERPPLGGTQSGGRGWAGSSNVGSGAMGQLAALAVEGRQHSSSSPTNLHHLRHVAAGLLQLSALGGGFAGSNAAGAAAGGGLGNGGGGGRWVDGLALQQHCRAAGLAGFKLPRVFLALLPAADGGTGEALPANSTGKVLKHLVKERVEREMHAVAAVAPTGQRAEGSAVPRSRL